MPGANLCTCGGCTPSTDGVGQNRPQVPSCSEPFGVEQRNLEFDVIIASGNEAMYYPQWGASIVGKTGRGESATTTTENALMRAYESYLKLYVKLFASVTKKAKDAIVKVIEEQCLYCKSK